MVEFRSERVFVCTRFFFFFLFHFLLQISFSQFLRLPFFLLLLFSFFPSFLFLLSSSSSSSFFFLFPDHYFSILLLVIFFSLSFFFFFFFHLLLLYLFIYFFLLFSLSLLIEPHGFFISFFQIVGMTWVLDQRWSNVGSTMFASGGSIFWLYVGGVVWLSRQM